MPEANSLIFRGVVNRARERGKKTVFNAHIEDRGVPLHLSLSPLYLTPKVCQGPFGSKLYPLLIKYICIAVDWLTLSQTKVVN